MKEIIKTRLDQKFMTNLWIKHYCKEYDMSGVRFSYGKNYIKVYHNVRKEYITIYVEPFYISTFEIDINPEIVWDILTRIKCCANCKYYDTDSCGCSKTADSLKESDRNFVHENSDKVFLYICDDPVDVEIEINPMENRVCSGYLDPEDIEERVSVNFGTEYCCLHHKFKELI